MKASSNTADVCPCYQAAIELIGKRWTGAILSALAEGPMRYASLARSIEGVSDRLLSCRLRELEREGLVERTVEPGTPVRVYYSLTPKAQELRPVFEQLGDWARRWVEVKAV